MSSSTTAIHILQDEGAMTKPHPYLTKPVLYVCNLPLDFKKDRLSSALKQYAVTRITLDLKTRRKRSQRTSGESGPSLVARVDFQSIASAEKAFATSHLQPIPAIQPPLLMNFSFAADGQLIKPHPSVLPRFVLRAPSGIESVDDSSQIYHILRPFGPIYSVHHHVQFWNEDDARQAELHVKEFCLRAYHPSTLFCRNLSAGLDVDSLRECFEKFGRVTRVILPRRLGRNRGFGFIHFESAEEASNAMRAMDGAVFGAGPIHVQYSEKRSGPIGPAAETQFQDAQAETSSPPSDTSRSKVDECEIEADDSDTDSQATSVDTVKSCLTECEWQAIEARIAFQTSHRAGKVDEYDEDDSDTVSSLSYSSKPSLPKADTTIPPDHPCFSYEDQRHDYRFAENIGFNVEVGGSPITPDLDPSDFWRAKAEILDRALAQIETGEKYLVKIHQLETENRELHERRRAADEELEKNRSLIEEAKLLHEIQQREIAELCSKDTSMTGQLKDLVADIDVRKVREDQLHCTIGDLRRETDVLRDNSERDLDEGRAREKHMMETMTKQADMIHSLQSSKDRVEEEHTNLLSQNLSLLHRFRTIQREKDDCSALMEGVTTLNANLDEQLHDLKSRTDAKQELLDRLEQERSVISSSLESANETIVELHREVAELERQAEGHALIVEEAKNQSEALRRCQEQWEYEKSVLSSSLEVSDEKIVDLQRQTTDLERQVEESAVESQRRHDSLCQEKQEVQESLEHAQAEIWLLKSDIDQLREELRMSESRRKILELEADRHLWEESRKVREEKERREQEKADVARKAAALKESIQRMADMRAEEEKKRRAAEEAKKAQERRRKEQEEKERKARETAKSERIAQELRQQQWRAAATEKEKVRCRDRDVEKWGTGPWTHARALQRFRSLSEEFLKISFSESKPLTEGAIPWPVLDDPFDFQLEHLDWQRVEAFFKEAARMLGGTSGEYKTLVEKSHRLFHPDRWRSRNLMVTVLDEDLRKSLEKSGNTVSQAITPLWTKSRSM